MWKKEGRGTGLRYGLAGGLEPSPTLCSIAATSLPNVSCNVENKVSDFDMSILSRSSGWSNVLMREKCFVRAGPRQGESLSCSLPPPLAIWPCEEGEETKTCHRGGTFQNSPIAVCWPSLATITQPHSLLPPHTQPQTQSSCSSCSSLPNDEGHIIPISLHIFLSGLQARSRCDILEERGRHMPFSQQPCPSSCPGSIFSFALPFNSPAILPWTETPLWSLHSFFPSFLPFLPP